MTVSYRVGRYLVALLWHWVPPTYIGFAAGFMLSIFQMETVNDYFYQAMTKVVHQCASGDPASAVDAEQVKGRAPGSSDHASPIRRTEARAQRTLERPPDKTASALESGAAPPPRAPEPSAARVG